MKSSILKFRRIEKRWVLVLSGWWVLALAALSLSGCAWLLKPPAEEEVARQRVLAWSAHNETLTRFKELLRIELQSGESRWSGRAALAAVAPDHLRVDWLNMLGQPVASLAANGDTIFYIPPGEQKVMQFNQTPDALKRLIHIPIGIHDLLDVLAGRPPLPADTIAQKGDSACDVVLKNRWHQTLATLQSENCSLPESMSVYDGEGTLQYRIDWAQWQTVNGYTLPKQMQLQAGSGERVNLNVDRIWPEAPVPPSLFTIVSPNI